MDQNRFAAMRFCLMVDGVVGRGVGDENTSALRERNTIGQREDLRFEREREFGIGAGETFRDIDAVAGFYFFHAIADGIDDASSFAAGSIGKRREDGIVAGARVSVGGIHTGGVDFYQHLSSGGFGRGEFFELENFGTAE